MNEIYISNQYISNIFYTQINNIYLYLFGCRIYQFITGRDTILLSLSFKKLLLVLYELIYNSYLYIPVFIV